MVEIKSFDLNSLVSYYQVGAQLPTGLQAEVLRQGKLKSLLANKSDVTPPWQEATTEPTSEEIKNRLFASKALIDLDDETLDREGITDDFKKLFALYKGLTRLQELTDYAKSDKGADSIRSLLDRQFQSLMGQLDNYLSTLDLDDVTLVPGITTDNTTTSSSFINPYEAYVGGIAANTRDQAITGVAGSEVFTISVTVGGVATDVTVDLANLTGAASLDNVVALMNQAMSDAGFSTTFEVDRVAEDQYRIKINEVSGETLNFASVTAGSAALYVAGSAGTGGAGGGSVRKLDDLAGTPATIWEQGVSTEDGATARGVAVDSQHNVYVVGTNFGDLAGQPGSGSEDVYLRKYDASGKLVWTQVLGAASATQGVTIAVDADDNVVIAGQSSALLTDTATGGAYDSFVSKFDSTGQELWTRQTAPTATDGATGLAVDASGNIFVTGYTTASIDGTETHAGGSDVYVTKLDGDGNLVYNRQLGGASDDFAGGIAIDDAGNFYVSYTRNGAGYVEKYADAASGAATWSVDLGALGGDGAVTGLARDATTGAIYVAGYSDGDSLTGASNSRSGGVDAFLVRIDDAGATASLNFAEYVGTSGDDRSFGVTVSGNAVYLSGTTGGQLPGATQLGTQDGFAAAFDTAGTIQWAQQFGGAFATRGTGLVVDSAGDDILARLGLPTGTLPEPSTTVTSTTAARAGQYFYVSVDDGPKQRIVIEEDMTFGLLAAKITQALGGYTQSNGRAIATDEYGLPTFQITAVNGAKVTIEAGPEGIDALAALGLQPTTLYGEPADVEAAETASESIFELGIFDGLSVATAKDAAATSDVIANALLMVRKAYNYIQNGPEPDPLSQITGPAPEYLQKQLAAYQAAVDQLSNTVQTSVWLPPLSI